MQQCTVICRNCISSVVLSLDGNQSTRLKHTYTHMYIMLLTHGLYVLTRTHTHMCTYTHMFNTNFQVTHTLRTLDAQVPVRRTQSLDMAMSLECVIWRQRVYLPPSRRGETAGRTCTWKYAASRCSGPRFEI